MRCVAALVLSLSLAGSVWAQTDTTESRPALPSHWGDTGLWFLPSAEVLPRGRWNFSLYRTEFDFNQGFTDVSDWPITFATGLGPRAELFGAVRVVTRIDRDVSPLFFSAPPDDGGLVNDYPFVKETWTGNHFGDMNIGGKFKLAFQNDRRPAVAFRLNVKLPTADSEEGVGTGAFDYFADVIASTEVGQRIELSGFGGVAFRGDPSEDLNLSNSFRFGLGSAFGTRANLRYTAELFADLPFDAGVINAAEQAEPLFRAADGELPPGFSELDSQFNAAFGATWHHRSGVALGGGLTYRFALDARSDVSSANTDKWNDGFGLQFRIGFSPTTRRIIPGIPTLTAPPPPPAPSAAPTESVVAPNRPPALQAQCNPCRVEVGGTLMLRAEGRDPDGDPLRYRWSSQSGSIADPLALSTLWTAAGEPGTTVLTITAEDGRGGSASDTVTIDVVRGSVPVLADVLFDFDADTLRPDVLATIQQAIAELRAKRSLALNIEGHASSEGTAEYNLALGERRARAVRDYMVSNDIEADRLTIVSYGEEKPRFDNTQEETRKLNRRAAMILREQNDDK